MAPKSLPIIPHSLPLEIVEEEHLITSNLLSLLEDRAPLTGDLRLKHRTRNKRHGLRLHHRPLTVGIPVQPLKDPTGGKGVSAR